MWRGEFGGSDRRDRRCIWRLTDTFGSRQSMTTDVSSPPDVISSRLIDHGIEVGAKLVSIDSHIHCRQLGGFCSGNEGAATST